jgi:hypothetical protein
VFNEHCQGLPLEVVVADNGSINIGDWRLLAGKGKTPSVLVDGDVVWYKTP